MSAALPAFARATRLAKTLFSAFDACIVLMGPDGPWRSRYVTGQPDHDDEALQVIATGKPTWVEDTLADPAFGDNVLVTGPMAIRCYVAAPVRLANGTTPGVICVVLREPRRYDRTLAARLCDLAATVADECERAIASEASARNARELEATRNVLAAFAETTPVSVVMLDREMRVLKASHSWLKDFKVSEDEVIGRTIYEIAPDRYPRYQAACERVLTGEVIRNNRVKWREAGGVRWLQSALLPWRDEAGEIGGILIAAHDVTEMVEAMDRTERSEARLKLALEMAEMHVYEMDFARGALEKAGSEALFFETPQTFDDLQENGLMIVHPDDRERVAELLRRHLEEDAPYSAEYRINRDDREVWAASVSKLTRDNHGRIMRLTGAMQDVTARKRSELAILHAKEEAETANQAKSAFLATMSHEIRTPLNGVLGMAQAMAAGELSNEQRQRLDVVRQSGETLLAILNDVLDISKIEAGKLELEDAEFDITELAKSAHQAFSAIAGAKDLTFKLKVEPSARGTYRGDSTRVRQILYNLISNALKFTEAGSVRVVVARPDETLRITVTDTGIGISSERLDSLFEKFEQAELSTARRYGGTGLGLSICRELASLMGGSIEAESKPAHGAAFTVVLPLPRIATKARKAAAKAVQQAVTERPLKVLAAEDNTVNQLVLRTLLQQIGIEPVIVDNGAHAVVAWEREAWDLILMDAQMPEVDGATATKIIREREQACGRSRTPIIALTANAMAHQVDEYRAVGMDGVVAKPIEIGRLFAAMQAVMADDATESAEAAA
ncbi:hypothetical protein BH11PSE2_BH11PSE2_05560 [soil metagenome]